MSASAADPDRQAQARRLRRWTWALLAVAWALMAGIGSALHVAPEIAVDAVSKLLGAGVVLGILAYFVVRGEPTYRKARGYWFGALVIVLGVAPAMFVAQRLEQGRETEKVNAIVKAMGESLQSADREFAERLKAGLKESTRAVLASETVTDAVARKDARSNLAAVIAIVDDGLAKRARIPQDAIAQVQAGGAPDRVKRSIIGEIRAAGEGREPLSVQMMKGTRAFLAKFDELIAHVDRNGEGIEVREGRLEFVDGAAGDRYNALQPELAALEAELRRLQQEVLKLR